MCNYCVSLFQEAEFSESDEDVSNTTSRADDEPHIPHADSVSSQTEDTILHVTEVSIQTETTFTFMISTAVQTNISINPSCYQSDAAIQCTFDEEIGKENSLPADNDVNCEGNKDEKFYPLVEKYKGIFKDVSGWQFKCLAVFNN